MAGMKWYDSKDYLLKFFPLVKEIKIKKKGGEETPLYAEVDNQVIFDSYRAMMKKSELKLSFQLINDKPLAAAIQKLSAMHSANKIGIVRIISFKGVEIVIIFAFCVRTIKVLQK